MTERKPPVGLGARGRRLYRALTDDVDLPPGALVLVEEACRTADRLERLDRALRGNGAEWLRVRESHREAGGDLVLVVNPVLAEARQQQNALRQILATLEVAAAKAVESKAQEVDPLRAIVDGSNVYRLTGSTGL